MSFVDRQPFASRIVGVGLVVALHVALIYAIVTGLAFRAVEAVRAPIVTEIIAAAPPTPPPPAPPPPPEFAPPPTAFVPPPEINIKKPPPPPPTESKAITAVTPVKPPVVAEPRPAPPAVRVLPRIDNAKSEAPEYPPVSRRLGEQGTVILAVMVDAAGRAVDAKIVQSSGFPRLDQAAIAGVKNNYHFIPGTVDGKPQPMWYTFKFTWKLR